MSVAKHATKTPAQQRVYSDKVRNAKPQEETLATTSAQSSQESESNTTPVNDPGSYGQPRPRIPYPMSQDHRDKSAPRWVTSLGTIASVLGLLVAGIWYLSSMRRDLEHVTEISTETKRILQATDARVYTTQGLVSAFQARLDDLQNRISAGNSGIEDKTHIQIMALRQELLSLNQKDAAEQKVLLGDLEKRITTLEREGKSRPK